MSTNLLERLEDLSHGEHSCLIFSSLEEQARINVDYLRIGLQRGERAVYVGDPASVQMLKDGLSDAKVDVAGESGAGRLILSSDRDYLEEGHFSPEKMLGFLQVAYDDAITHGFKALRAAGNVAWQVGPDQDFKDVVHYEALLDLFFLGKRMVGLCEYPKHGCPSETLSGILNTHRTAAVDHELCFNHHYVPPELLLEKDHQVRESRRVEWMTSQMVRMRQAEGERDRLQAQLTQAQKLEVVGRLAGGVAHDFNNLLNIILGYNSLMLQDAHLEDPSRDMLERVQGAGERAQALTRQLLAHSKRQVLQPQRLDLNEVVKGAQKLLADMAGPLVRLVLRPGPGLGPVKADPVQVEQVLMNLVINAREAMPGGGTLTLETANAELEPGRSKSHAGALEGPHVMLQVTDTGVGMEEETRRKVFEPFFTTKAEGTGLGLATVFSVVRQCRGDIQVISSPGQGASFKVYFPSTGASEKPPS